MPLTDEDRRRGNERMAHLYADPATREIIREKARKTRMRNREQKMNFTKLAKYMMEADIPDADAAYEELLEHGFDQFDYQAALFWSQLKKAIYNADTEAAKFVRDTAGYKPTDAMQIGNLDDKPFMELDLSKLSNEELRKMIAERESLLGGDE